MKRVPALVLATALAAGFVAVGCEANPIDKTGGRSIASAPKICAKCGQIKGTAMCCAPDAAICPKCGLVKGSPGCCKLPNGANQDVLLCAMCGQIKGSDLCCKADAAICPKCGLPLGAAGSSSLVAFVSARWSGREVNGYNQQGEVCRHYELLGPLPLEPPRRGLERRAGESIA